MESKPKRSGAHRALTSAVLDDGTIVEMVYDVGAGKTRFLLCDGTEVVHAAEVAAGDSLAVPYSPGNNLLTHRVVLFPSGADEYDSEDTLAEEVRGFIHRYVDVSEIFEEIAAYYVLLTWIHDAFNELPYLRVRGDYGTGKSRFLLTVGSVCYKPIFASGASTVSPIFRILDSIGGTLVVDEADFRASDEKAEIIKILNNGNARGFPVLRSEATPTREFNPRAFTVYGPKLVATRGLFEDPALESRCITEEMSGAPPRAGIPLNLPACFHEEAQALRNKLLTFRFRHLHTDRNLEGFHDGTLEPRVSQIIAPLLATMSSGRARGALRQLARRHSGALAAERELSIEHQVLEVLHDLQAGGRTLAVKDITEEFASRFGSEFDRLVTPRWIGSVLRRRLSLQPVRREGSFLIPRDEYPRLELLFDKYGLGDVRGPSVTSVDAASESDGPAGQSPAAATSTGDIT